MHSRGTAPAGSISGRNGDSAASREQTGGRGKVRGCATSPTAPTIAIKPTATTEEAEPAEELGKASSVPPSTAQAGATGQTERPL